MCRRVAPWLGVNAVEAATVFGSVESVTHPIGPSNMAPLKPVNSVPPSLFDKVAVPEDPPSGVIETEASV